MRTLIIAVGLEGINEVGDAHLFEAVHEGDIKVAIRQAFGEWAKTQEGRDYIDENGVNWGDALEIPDRYLKAFGVDSLCALEEYTDEGFNIPGGHFDAKLVVNHDEEVGSYYDLPEASSASLAANSVDDLDDEEEGDEEDE